jgi:hypothetical protein
MKALIKDASQKKLEVSVVSSPDPGWKVPDKMFYILQGQVESGKRNTKSIYFLLISNCFKII